MPRKADNPAAVETEKGFGTGLRVKLEGRNAVPGPSAPAPTPDEVEVGAEPKPEAEPEAVQVESPPAAEPELSETEQLWAELEESLAREETLKRALDEQRETFERAADLERRLTRRVKALDDRERKLDAQLQELDAERAAPAEQSPEGSPPGPNETGRAYLRRKADEAGEQIWRVFLESLTATKPNGQPDFRTRLMAATALLGEAYGDTGQMSPGEQVAAARDELAGMRARKAQKPR